MRRITPAVVAAALLLGGCAAGEAGDDAAGATAEPVVGSADGVPDGTGPDEPAADPDEPAADPDGDGDPDAADPDPADPDAADPGGADTGEDAPGTADDDPAGPSFADAPRRVLPLDEFEFMVGMTPDGLHLVVDAPFEDGERCEEGDPFALLTRPLDDAAAPFRSLFDPPRSGGLLPMDDGRRLVLSGCEGFLSDVEVARFDGDGTARIVQRVTLPATSDGFVDVTAVAPVPGVDRFEAVRFADGGPELVAFGADGVVVGSPVPLDREYYRMAVSASGTWAIRFRDDTFAAEVVELRSDRFLPGYGELVVSPDGSDLVVAGDGGLGVVRADGELERWIDDPLGDQVGFHAPTWVSEDRALVVRDPFGAGELLMVGPDGVVEVVDRGVGDVPAPALSADASRLVYNLLDPDTFDVTAVLRDLRGR